MEPRGPGAAGDNGKSRMWLRSCELQTCALRLITSLCGRFELGFWLQSLLLVFPLSSIVLVTEWSPLGPRSCCGREQHSAQAQTSLVPGTAVSQTTKGKVCKGVT